MYVLRATEVVKRLLYLGLLNKVYGEALSRGPSPDPFILIPVPFLTERVPLSGVANGTTKNVGLGKFWQDLEISEAFLISLEVSFLHGLFLLFLSLETFYQRVSGSDF